MTGKDEKISNHELRSKLPCQYCLNYLFDGTENEFADINSDRLELLKYLNAIKDPRIILELIALLKNISQL